jgi:hypothetical protein
MRVGVGLALRECVRTTGFRGTARPCCRRTWWSAGGPARPWASVLRGGQARTSSSVHALACQGRNEGTCPPPRLRVQRRSTVAPSRACEPLPLPWACRLHFSRGLRKGSGSRTRRIVSGESPTVSLAAEASRLQWLRAWRLLGKEVTSPGLHVAGSWCRQQHRQDWAAFLASLKLRLYSKKVVELKAAVQARRGSA